MKITVWIKIFEEEGKSSEGKVETNSDSSIESENFETLAEAIFEAIPKNYFPPFDVLEFYLNGKRVAHAE